QERELSGRAASGEAQKDRRGTPSDALRRPCGGAQLREQGSNSRAILFELFSQLSEQAAVCRALVRRGETTDDVDGGVGAAQMIAKIGDQRPMFLIRRP